MKFTSIPTFLALAVKEKQHPGVFSDLSSTLIYILSTLIFNDLENYCYPHVTSIEKGAKEFEQLA